MFKSEFTDRDLPPTIIKECIGDMYHDRFVI